jgi:hypothetical protein
MTAYDAGADRLPIGADTGSPDRALRRELMLLRRQMSALFVVVALAGCASVTAGPRQAPNAPYQQGDPRDTSGMH